MKNVARKMMIGYFVALGAAVAVTTLPDMLLPASYWFTVKSVHVSDSVAASSPLMKVDRIIRREFDADWNAEVEREVQGRFLLVCQGRGHNTYSPDNALPDHLDLNWWTYPKRCDLAPGRYRVTTSWKIRPDRLSPRRVQAISNTFEIR